MAGCQLLPGYKLSKVSLEKFLFIVPWKVHRFFTSAKHRLIKESTKLLPFHHQGVCRFQPFCTETR